MSGFPTSDGSQSTGQLISARRALPQRWRLGVHEFRDGYLPYTGAKVKDAFEALKHYAPDIIFTHHRDDRHQDHWLVSDPTWNTWRSHLVLEYEIPKYDGDFGSPNVFAPLPSAVVDRKIDLILAHFQLAF